MEKYVYEYLVVLFLSGFVAGMVSDHIVSWFISK